MLWVTWLSWYPWGFCKERKLCVYSGVGSYQLTFGKGTQLSVIPRKFFFSGLLFSPRSLSSITQKLSKHRCCLLCLVCVGWFVILVGKQGYSCTQSLGCCSWTFNTHVVCPWKKKQICIYSQGGRSRKQSRERQELDENRQRAWRNNKQDRIPGDRALTTWSEFPRRCSCQGLFFPGKVTANRTGLGSHWLSAFLPCSNLIARRLFWPWAVISGFVFLLVPVPHPQYHTHPCLSF